MAWYDPRHILAFFKRTRLPIVVNGEIHPILQVIARRGYWLQSRVLRIPDRFGLLSSGPPLLQAFQAHKLYSTATEAVLPVIGASITELMVFETGWLPQSMAVVCLLFIISVYIGEVFFNPMRASDYDWKTVNERMGVVQLAA